ncbi:hypothetical protein [Lysinibacter cavernae]|uniref:Putative membrane protein YeaQ/YmgE (Transglycosylase-associated protein family) n=1 Tax=Lysinibacter cavernae TaxID=1640652 RepID=A0A7X5QYN1_9MICO|nr:hypothetical protein [Lysinibacter cavernae]NIH52354.1 putative membrane protein YeaQ/YmgE (transglycosylase-associated protein family) [Lysinibacter cavernae]
MELIFVVLIGLVIGLIVRYAVPGRQTYGFGVQLALGAAASAAVWVLLTVAGMKWDGFWIWAITIAATIVACVLYAVIVPRRRTLRTEQRYHELLRAAV